MPDATCAPQQIAFPQDINLLNEARENLESLIDDICSRFHYYKPRMYRQNARKDYLSLAKCRKRTAKKIRKAIGKQLRYVNRDLSYIDLFFSQDDVSLKPKQTERLQVIRELVEQQQYMYDNKVHSVKDRIEVAREFSLAKRCYGLGLLHTKLDMTTRGSIALSIMAMNVNRLAGSILRCMGILMFSRCRWWKNLLENTMSEPCFCIEV